MRLSWAAAAVSLLAAAPAAAKKSPDEIFSTYHKEQLSSSPLKLSERTFEELTSGPRNYTAAITLTALDARFACKMCTEFAPEWQILAKSWVKGDQKGQSRIIFGTLDFIDAKPVFQALQLQTAPVVFLFPPTVGPNAKPNDQPARFDFSSGPQSAEMMHAWVSRHMPQDAPRPPIRRPINWIRNISVTTALLGLITAVSVAYPYLLPIITNRNLWAAGSIIGILLFTTGHMFNHIRQVPYVLADQKAGITYFANGFQSQFGLESQIIAAIYALLAFATISLAVKVPTIQNPKTQQVAVFVWGAVMYGAYSFLLSIFRSKNGGYPFWLPPF